MLKGLWFWLLELAAYGDTRPTRLTVGWLNLFAALYVHTDQAVDDMALMMLSIPVDNPEGLWSTLFVINGIALLYGLTGKYNFWTLFLEGVLGVFIWTIFVLTHAVAQGVPGPAVVVVFLMAWILMRYPTHWGRRD